MSPNADPERGAAVLERAVSLLDALAAEGEMRPADLAALVDEPRSTVYRLLATMRDLGLVEPGQGRGTHRLGLKLLRLGDAASKSLELRPVAKPVMERLNAETGETIFLCLRRGSDAVCVERKDGARVQVLEMQLGGTLPLHLGAAPRALLAFSPRQAWDEYIAQSGVLAGLTPESVTAPEDLIEDLEATLERGYAISDQDVTDGIAAVGAPIFDDRGAVVAALSVSGIRKGILGPESAVAELTSKGAREISRALGYRIKENENSHA